MIIGQRCDNTVRDGRVEYTTVSTSHTSVVLKANRNRRQSVGSRIHLGPSPYENRGSQVGINWVRIPVLTGGGGKIEKITHPLYTLYRGWVWKTDLGERKIGRVTRPL